MKEISPKKKIQLIAEAALAKKAEDAVLIDLRRLSSVCDYFIVASGESTVQIDSIADNIEKELSAHNFGRCRREGRGDALWILLDYGDIVVHIFYKDTRGFYNLEKLWHDAPQKKLKHVHKKIRKKSKRAH